MTSPQHFSRREEVKLKNVDFKDVQYVISEVRSYLPKQKTYESQQIEFDDGQGLDFNSNLDEIVEEYSKKGLNPKRVASNFAYTRPSRTGTKIILLTLWVDYSKLEISIGVQGGTMSDVDWAKSKSDSIKSLLKPLAAGEIKQSSKDTAPILSSKAEPSSVGMNNIDWKWLVGTVIGLLGLFLAYLGMKH